MKYFVISDIHSFYDEMIDALNEAGFDKDNENHTLIVCGDIFDRGRQPLEVYEYLKSLPRKILIRGNHEYLLKELYERKIPYTHDVSNGTFDTLAYIVGQPSYKDFRMSELFMKAIDGTSVGDYAELNEKYNQKEEEREKKLFNNKKVEEIINWIFSDEWVNYFELDKYIFVHSFIPLYIHIGTYFDTTRYIDGWREATPKMWEQATWGCPWELYKNGYNKTGKCIVCGHWHTSDFYNNLDHKDYEKDNNPIYYSEGLIGLDACTVLSREINILIVEE